MSEGAWYVDPEAGPVEGEDTFTYDEAWGPRLADDFHGRLVEDDEGLRPDITAEAVAHLARGDTRWLSAEEAAVHVVDPFEEAMQELDGDVLDR